MGQVTIGSNTVDVFGTRAAADLHFGEQLAASTWEDADAADRDKALVSATRWLERVGVVGDDGEDLAPSLADTNVPADLKLGTYELAQDLLADASIQDGDLPGSTNTKGVKAGSTAVSFFRAKDGKRFPTVVLDYVASFLQDNQTTTATGNAAFGVDGVSTFDDVDQWGRTRGFP